MSIHHLGPLVPSTGRRWRWPTELGQPADQARAHDGLGHAHRALGQFHQAREHWQYALAILTDLGANTDEEASTASIWDHLASIDDQDRCAGGRCHAPPAHARVVRSCHCCRRGAAFQAGHNRTI